MVESRRAVPEWVLQLPEISRLDRLKHALQEINPSFKKDFHDKDANGKVRAIGSIAGVGAVEAIGLLRINSIVTTQEAFKVAELAGPMVISSVAAGIATGATYGVLTAATSKALDYGVSSFPKTLAATGNVIPGKNNLEKVFPSLTAEDDITGIHRRTGALLKHGAGAYVALAPQIYAAGLLGHSQEKRQKLCRRLSGGGALFVGALAAATTLSVDTLEKVSPATSNAIVEGAQNTKLLAATFIGISVGPHIVKGMAKKSSEIFSKTAMYTSILGKLCVRPPKRKVKAVGSYINQLLPDPT